jgi:hypothetical protein
MPGPGTSPRRNSHTTAARGIDELVEAERRDAIGHPPPGRIGVQFHPGEHRLEKMHVRVGALRQRAGAIFAERALPPRVYRRSKTTTSKPRSTSSCADCALAWRRCAMFMTMKPANCRSALPAISTSTTTSRRRRCTCISTKGAAWKLRCSGGRFRCAAICRPHYRRARRTSRPRGLFALAQQPLARRERESCR